MKEKAVVYPRFTEHLTYGNGCRHHDDCFTCPFADCIAGNKSASYIAKEGLRDSKAKAMLLAKRMFIESPSLKVVDVAASTGLNVSSVTLAKRDAKYYCEIRDLLRLNPTATAEELKNQTLLHVQAIERIMKEVRNARA